MSERNEIINLMYGALGQKKVTPKKKEMSNEIEILAEKLLVLRSEINEACLVNQGTSLLDNQLRDTMAELSYMKAEEVVMEAYKLGLEHAEESYKITLGFFQWAVDPLGSEAALFKFR